MQHRPITASKPAPRHAPLIAVATAAVSLLAAAAIVAAAPEPPTVEVDQLPPPAGVETDPAPPATPPETRPTTAASAPTRPSTSPAVAPDGTRESATSDATTPVTPAEPAGAASVTAEPTPAMSTPSNPNTPTTTPTVGAGTDAVKDVWAATVEHAADPGPMPEGADQPADVEEPPLAGVPAGEIGPGDLSTAMPVIAPTLHQLHPVVVPEITDLLVDGRRDRRDDRDDRDDDRRGKPPTAPVDDFEWGGENPGQIAPGCLGGCVTSALIFELPTTADVGFEITTDTPTRFDVTVADVETLEKLHFSNGGYDTEWGATLGPLVAGRHYAVLIQVNDQFGYEEILTHQFTAPDPVAPAWDVASNVLGCAAQCIEHGVVRTTDDPSSVVVEVGTSVSAWVTVWVSEQAPDIVGGVPTLPDSAIEASPPLAGTAWEFGVDGLAPDTLHHVIVQAVDDDGGVSVRAGQFVTEYEYPELVEATFRWIRIEHDGDEGLTGGKRGEIQLGWGAANGMAGLMSEDKLDAGDVVHLSGNNVFPAHASSTNAFPPLVVVAVERDFSMTEFGQVIPYPFTESFTDGSFAITVAWTLPMHLDDIEALPSCQAHAGGAAWADDRCVLLESAHPSGDHVEFETLISFRIVD